MKTASSRKNGTFGYKAVVVYDVTTMGPMRKTSMTKVPIRHNFPTAEAAKAYAQKWIDANNKR